MTSKMENEPINLIGCDTIVNSPSLLYIMSHPIKLDFGLMFFLPSLVKVCPWGFNMQLQRTNKQAVEICKQSEG